MRKKDISHSFLTGLKQINVVDFVGSWQMYNLQQLKSIFSRLPLPDMKSFPRSTHADFLSSLRKFQLPCPWIRLDPRVVNLYSVTQQHAKATNLGNLDEDDVDDDENDENDMRKSRHGQPKSTVACDRIEMKGSSQIHFSHENGCTYIIGDDSICRFKSSLDDMKTLTLSSISTLVPSRINYDARLHQIKEQNVLNAKSTRFIRLLTTSRSPKYPPLGGMIDIWKPLDVRRRFDEIDTRMVDSIRAGIRTVDVGRPRHIMKKYTDELPEIHNESDTETPSVTDKRVDDDNSSCDIDRMIQTIFSPITSLSMTHETSVVKTFGEDFKTKDVFSPIPWKSTSIYDPYDKTHKFGEDIDLIDRCFSPVSNVYIDYAQFDFNDMQTSRLTDCSHITTMEARTPTLLESHRSVSFWLDDNLYIIKFDNVSQTFQVWHATSLAVVPVPLQLSDILGPCIKFLNCPRFAYACPFEKRVWVVDSIARNNAMMDVLYYFERKKIDMDHKPTPTTRMYIVCHSRVEYATEMVISMKKDVYSKVTSRCYLAHPITGITTDIIGSVYLSFASQNVVWKYNPNIHSWSRIGSGIRGVRDSPSQLQSRSSHDVCMDRPSLLTHAMHGKLILIYEQTTHNIRGYCVMSDGVIMLQRVKTLCYPQLMSLYTVPRESNSLITGVFELYGMTIEGGLTYFQVWLPSAELASIIYVLTQGLLTMTHAVLISEYAWSNIHEFTLFNSADRCKMANQLQTLILFQLGIDQFKSYKSTACQYLKHNAAVDDDDFIYLDINGSRSNNYLDFMTEYERRQGGMVVDAKRSMSDPPKSVEKDFDAGTHVALRLGKCDPSAVDRMTPKLQSPDADKQSKDHIISMEIYKRHLGRMRQMYNHTTGSDSEEEESPVNGSSKSQFESDSDVSDTDDDMDENVLRCIDACLNMK